MKSTPKALISRVKSFRTAKGFSQTQLADLVGVKRQAIYDIETGKYAPNTLLALRLAKHLGCRVEDLFSEEAELEAPCTVMGVVPEDFSRVSLTMLRGNLLAYPLTGSELFSTGFEAADGLITPGQDRVKLLSPSQKIDKSIVLLGCDPAFTLLSTHVARQGADVNVYCRFASSVRAVRGLASGQAHIAGTHLHAVGGGSDANIQLAQQHLAAQQAQIFRFAEIEEGLIVARGNPLGIRSLKDFENPAVRLINREPGAALRTLLDELLKNEGLPTEKITGYTDTVQSHSEGAQRVLYNQADAALGFRAVASLYGLDFVPLTSARCELVLPTDLLDHPGVQVLLDTMQTRAFRNDIEALAGYDGASTGAMTTEI